MILKDLIYNGFCFRWAAGRDPPDTNIKKVLSGSVNIFAVVEKTKEIVGSISGEWIQ